MDGIADMKVLLLYLQLILVLLVEHVCDSLSWIGDLGQIFFGDQAYDSVYAKVVRMCVDGSESTCHRRFEILPSDRRTEFQDPTAIGRDHVEEEVPLCLGGLFSPPLKFPLQGLALKCLEVFDRRGASQYSIPRELQLIE